MTVSSNISRVNYTGNGSVSNYSYTFKIFEAGDLLVTVRNLDDVETTLTITTDYTVNGAGSASGGSIDLVNSSQAWLTGGNLTSGYVLTIRRVLDVVQETDIRNQGPFFPATHEDQFDKDIMIAQQLSDEIDRSIKLSETTTGVNATLPAPSAGLAIGWNADEDGLENIADLGGVSISAFGESLIDDADASAALTTLGVSTYAKTILDDADAAAARSTLGLGNTAVTNVDNSTVEINAGTLRIKDLGVTTAKLAAGAVTAAKIENNVSLTGNVQAGGKFVVASNTNDSANLALIAGSVNGASGAVIAGTGFTPTRNGTGDYTIAYTSALTGTPVGIVTSYTSDAREPKVTAISNTQATIKTYDASGTLADANFAFIIIGVKA